MCRPRAGDPGLEPSQQHGPGAARLGREAAGGLHGQGRAVRRTARLDHALDRAVPGPAGRHRPGGLRRTDAVLARGSMLGLFPEGTRGDGRFSAVHPGLAYIVVRQRCPVLPVAIFGTERVRRRFGWLPFASPVRIVIGPAIDLPPRPATGPAAGPPARSSASASRPSWPRRAAPSPCGHRAQSAWKQSDTSMEQQGTGQPAACPGWRWSGGPTSASRPWSTGSWAAGRPSPRKSPA